MFFKQIVFYIMISFFLFIPCLFAEQVGEIGIKVTEAVICKNVVERTPQDPGEVFPSNVEKLYAFSRIEGATGETQIKHLWFYNDNLMAEVSLPVRSANWRTYSSKRILPQWKGQWRVDITTAEGLLLKSLYFTIE